MDKFLMRILLDNFQYSLESIGYNFQALTKKEKEIFGCQENVNAIRNYKNEFRKENEL